MTRGVSVLAYCRRTRRLLATYPKWAAPNTVECVHCNHRCTTFRLRQLHATTGHVGMSHFYVTTHQKRLLEQLALMGFEVPRP